MLTAASWLTLASSPSKNIKITKQRAKALRDSAGLLLSVPVLSKKGPLRYHSGPFLAENQVG